MKRMMMVAALGLLGLAVAACKPEPAAQAGPAKLLRVASDTVCMNNNYFMGGPKQTPVPLDGKQYWVCCEGCKQTFHKLKEPRVAKDPVSGRSIDKSLAVIGKLPNNNILYFENEANLLAYVVPTPTPETGE